MFKIKRRYEGKTKDAHMKATVQKSGNNALPPQRILLHPVTRQQ